MFGLGRKPVRVSLTRVRSSERLDLSNARARSIGLATPAFLRSIASAAPQATVAVFPDGITVSRMRSSHTGRPTADHIA